MGGWVGGLLTLAFFLHVVLAEVALVLVLYASKSVSTGISFDTAASVGAGSALSFAAATQHSCARVPRPVATEFAVSCTPS